MSLRTDFGSRATLVIWMMKGLFTWLTEKKI